MSTKKRKIVKLCEECFFDYESGGIQFNDKNLKVVKVDSVDECYFDKSKRKIKRVI